MTKSCNYNSKIVSPIRRTSMNDERYRLLNEFALWLSDCFSLFFVFLRSRIIRHPSNNMLTVILGLSLAFLFSFISLFCYWFKNVPFFFHLIVSMWFFFLLHAKWSHRIKVRHIFIIFAMQNKFNIEWTEWFRLELKFQNVIVTTILLYFFLY